METPTHRVTSSSARWRERRTRAAPWGGRLEAASVEEEHSGTEVLRWTRRADAGVDVLRSAAWSVAHELLEPERPADLVDHFVEVSGGLLVDDLVPDIEGLRLVDGVLDLLDL